MGVSGHQSQIRRGYTGLKEGRRGRTDLRAKEEGVGQTPLGEGSEDGGSTGESLERRWTDVHLEENPGRDGLADRGVVTLSLCGRVCVSGKVGRTPRGGEVRTLR